MNLWQASKTAICWKQSAVIVLDYMYIRWNNFSKNGCCVLNYIAATRLSEANSKCKLFFVIVLQ